MSNSYEWSHKGFGKDVNYYLEICVIFSDRPVWPGRDDTRTDLSAVHEGVSGKGRVEDDFTIPQVTN